jgi:hypothetical protein
MSNLGRVDTAYVLSRLDNINNDGKNRKQGLEGFLRELKHNHEVDTKKSVEEYERTKIWNYMNDAEIIIIAESHHSIGGIKQPQEIIGTIPFSIGYDFSMYGDPIEDDDLSEFITSVMRVASDIRKAYEYYPDYEIHVQVRYTFGHVNV